MYVLITAGVLAGLAVTIFTLSAVSPTLVAYTESIEIEAPVADVFDDVRLQSRLMRWSAWPKQTGSTCAVDIGPNAADGTVGARTVFVSKGKAVGFQEITRIEDRREVALRLEGPGPPHEPEMRFKLEPLDENRTVVRLEFVNRLPRPFNAIWRFAGLTRWTRQLHLEDLEGLKAFSEPPHRDIDGRVVGRTPTLANPYETALPPR